MEQTNHQTLVIGKSNSEIYQYHGDDVFQNLLSLKSGRIKKEDASKFFKIPLVLNAMVMKNPLLLDLIKGVGMKYEGLGVTGTEEELKESIKTI